MTRMFPLPLSDFEYYMLVDDCPSHPMVFVMAAQLSGAFQKPALEQVLAELVDCHPLLKCTISEIPSTGWCWTPQTSEMTQNCLEWTDEDETSVAKFVPPVRVIDIRS